MLNMLAFALTMMDSAHNMHTICADSDIEIDSDDSNDDVSRENSCDNDGETFVAVGGGGAIDAAELRVYRGGLSAGEAKAMALAVHVLDPAGSRELET